VEKAEIHSQITIQTDQAPKNWTARNTTVNEVFMADFSATTHPTGMALERYYLRAVKDDRELSALQAHLYWCLPCVRRVEETGRAIEAARQDLKRCE
jgi:hypothetical protein